MEECMGSPFCRETQDLIAHMNCVDMPQDLGAVELCVLAGGLRFS